MVAGAGVCKGKRRKYVRRLTLHKKDLNKKSAVRRKWLRGPDLNRRPPGYEPDELPAALPRDVELSGRPKKGGAEDRA